MIIVTGGAGFIGSNLVKGLNHAGYNDILVVDNLQNGKKFKNLVNCRISDYLDKTEFLSLIKQEQFKEKIEVIFHQGACSATTEWDGRYMMENNYAYSKILLHFSEQLNIPFIYASSAAVYGLSHNFKINDNNEKPLNVYGYSKWLFDEYVRHQSPTNSLVVGLRYFNVYGPGEQHKGNMASTTYHFNQQLHEHAQVRLFAGCDGYANGEQQRDFIYIDDVVNVNLWFWKQIKKTPDSFSYLNGIYNVGTGESRTFNDMANAVINWHGKGKIEYIPFPEHLIGHYQSFTEADISELRKAGYTDEFMSLELGVRKYLDIINHS